ncbi:MAG TPA: 50S ribosomal protein L29 [Actinomycetota bacterium]|jgi:large subunit ribosomal protein L29|nr:50S ribosomal protein L29 [Actinomycetota bacterium]
MNVDALREMSSADLGERLDEVKEEFFNLRFQNATGQLENFAQIKQVKREIARINTLVHERELGIEIEPKPQKVAKAKPRKDKEKEGKEGKAKSKKAAKSDDDADGED